MERCSGAIVADGSRVGELVSVEPQYEFGDEESDDDEDSENGGAHGGFLEPFIQIEEDKHHS